MTLSARNQESATDYVLVNGRMHDIVFYMWVEEQLILILMLHFYFSIMFLSVYVNQLILSTWQKNYILSVGIRSITTNRCTTGVPTCILNCSPY